MTSYAAPMTTYGTSTVMPATTYAAPLATEAISYGGQTTIVQGTDFNRDGIPDAMEAPVATTTYVTQAAPMTTYAAPMATTTTLPTTSSMVAYPQTTGPFVFYPAGQMPATAAPEVKKADSPKRDVKVAKKKKAG